MVNGQVEEFSTNVFLVVSAVIGVAVAYTLFKFAWKHIKGSVSSGNLGRSFTSRDFKQYKRMK